jgi:hypothetical protein
MLYLRYGFWDIGDMKKLLFMVCMLCSMACCMSGNSFAAADCRDIEFVFARGSGAARNDTDE